ncbi:putative pectinesterase [Dioscorea sansibarensis]
MAKKFLIAGISVILVVAVAIGIVATITHSNQKTGDVDNATSVASASHDVTGICTGTDFQETCVKSLSKVLNGTTSPQDALRASIGLVIDEFNVSVNRAREIQKEVADKYPGAVSDCELLLSKSLANLNAALTSSGHTDKLSSYANDIDNWLSAVIASKGTCVDGFSNDQELQKKISDVFDYMTELISNSLAILEEVTTLLDQVQNLPNIKIPTTQRRLLSEEEVYPAHPDGFPVWLSPADRRLLRQRNGRVRPNMVVAQDGSGDYKTINQALKNLPKKYRGRFVIYVKAGRYREKVVIEEWMTNIMMYGDGSRKTVITGNSYKDDKSGSTTFNSATFSALGNGFIARDIGFSNTAGPENHQAVALTVTSDMSAFFRCRMDAYQDTLYVHSERQFYRNSVISGTVDFIFGDSKTVIQNCLIIVRKGSPGQKNMVTAQGRGLRRQGTALVIQNCRILPDKSLFPERLEIESYLGRPWKIYSRTIIMETTIGDLIRPEGWYAWDETSPVKYVYYGEYNNRGPGANTDRRVKWPGVRVISRREALMFTANSLLNARTWLRLTGIPYLQTFKS